MMIKNTSTTQKLLSIIEEKKTFSARDLALACGLCEPAVRYHLRKLVNMGLIVEVPNQESMLKAGRKVQLFKRNQPDQNQTLFLLCRLIIENLPSLLKDINPVEYLCDLVLIKNDNENITKKLPIKELVGWFNQRNYQVSWEAGSTGPILSFLNCPFHEIHMGNDILCEMDRQLLSIQSCFSWELTERRDWRTNMGACKFSGKRCV